MCNIPESYTRLVYLKASNSQGHLNPFYAQSQGKEELNCIHLTTDTTSSVDTPLFSDKNRFNHENAVDRKFSSYDFCNEERCLSQKVDEKHSLIMWVVCILCGPMNLLLLILMFEP